MNATNRDFSERVYRAVSHLPRGKVATYGQIAKIAGSARAARAVGTLMARNKNTTRVPCHRVVGAGGALVGYGFGGVSVKRKMLIDEGVSFKGTRVNMATSGYSPAGKV